MKEESRRLLPPMAMLHAFSAAARTGSFSRAAAEVGLTQGAISRQVAALEEWLGRPLFDRHGRRVKLNPAGRAYADAIAASLAGIRHATREALGGPRERRVSLAVLPSFGMRWLAPRLPRLTERHPDLVVDFTARADEFSFADEPFDAAIHFGRPDWPGTAHDLLFRERVLPVMAPALAERVARAEDVARLPLLVQTLRPDAWSRWFAAAGIDTAVPAPTASFSHFLMLAQAAVAGAGAALIPAFLIAPELASGTLVAPVARPLESEGAYWLVYPPDRLAQPAFADLRAWLLAEAAAHAEV